ncbi:pyridoxamine 5'-phosphate oxidase family protein [Intrasporangium sp.]|uniref:pyridoxamine 5'-phosphate oxidase family protein n=1 Tax=Intrasporangium sp. TaxID=1925024 RepID=UPI00293ABC91|nr:pyridoxamine 5'-phosphate oxidase family protein [Intrasporangium sp.]MDV3222763.1 pyridoxamine 5'-phosphate oxidase family protein [Intrasporangium sp.]
MFHPGEKAVQVRAGVEADAWGSSGVGRTIPHVAADFLGRQRFLSITALDGAGNPWTTQLTGAPGLVRVEAEDQIRVTAALSGLDPLADVLGTSATTPPNTAPVEVGILALEPTTRRRMRINGVAVRVDSDLVITTQQVYANCPKYIQTRTPHSAGDRPTTGRRESDTLAPEQERWIAGADTFFVGTASPGLGVDTSHRGGNPGFVTVGRGSLSWPDYVGNSMFMTLGNLEIEPRTSLLFLDWEHGHSLHLTGRARVDWDAGRAAAQPGALRHIDFDVDRVIQVDHASSLSWSFERYSRFNPA